MTDDDLTTTRTEYAVAFTDRKKRGRDRTPERIVPMSEEHARQRIVYFSKPQRDTQVVSVRLLTRTVTTIRTPWEESGISGVKDND